MLKWCPRRCAVPDKPRCSYPEPETQGSKPHLEGQRDLVSKFRTPITHLGTLVIPIINLLTKSPLTLQANLKPSQMLAEVRGAASLPPLWQAQQQRCARQVARLRVQGSGLRVQGTSQFAGHLLNRCVILPSGSNPPPPAPAKNSCCPTFFVVSVDWELTKSGLGGGGVCGAAG